MATSVESVEAKEIEQIKFWRLELLAQAGYEPAVAAELAGRLEIDLHQALDLIERGCPPDLAARILL